MSTVPQQPDSELQPAASFATDLYPQTVPKHLHLPQIPAWGLLDRAACAVPKNIACSFMGHELTYDAINGYSDQLAAWLETHGIHKGDRVAVLLPNCPEYSVALNGIWKAGGVVVAVSPLSVASDVRKLVDFTGCKLAITLDLLSGLLPKAQRIPQLLVSLRPYLPAWKRAGYLAALWHRTGHVRYPRTGTQAWFWSAVEETTRDRSHVSIDPEVEPAYILSTGGTTGDPKAVTLSHKNIVANAWQQMVWAGATMGQETMLAVLPFFHSYGMSTMIGSGAALGAKLVMLPRFNTKLTVDAIVKHRPTVFHAVPAMLSAMNAHLRKCPADMSSIKWVISGGASLPQDVAEEFAEHSGAIVVEGYGLSEASPVTHVGPLDGTNVSGTIGLPLPNTECRLSRIDDPYTDVEAGEVGELYVRGPQVMLGYWENTEATRESIVDGWLRTGDLACRTPVGFYKIVDRKKDLIITSGFNVYPADVEQVLRTCEEIKDVAVIGQPDDQRGEVVTAFVVLEDGCKWCSRSLEKFSKVHLAAHRRPRVWHHVKDDLPRNFLGKVIRRHLKNHLGEQK